MSLDINQVRFEIGLLIKLYPDRLGGEPSCDRLGGLDCTYYKDVYGHPEEIPNLVTPVCIIGQWIESFHPEFKEENNFHAVLTRNAIISTAFELDSLLGEEVRRFLGEIQQQQDDGRTWSEIELEDVIE